MEGEVLERDVIVGEGGVIHLLVDGLKVGQKVHLRIEPGVHPKTPRPLGDLRGKIHIAPDFDDPLPEFEEYL